MTTPASAAQIISAAGSSQSQSPSQTTQNQGATSKLQLMNLKAAAQGLGLDTGSFGWAILEKLASSDEIDEWGAIWSAITAGKVRLYK